MEKERKAMQKLQAQYQKERMDQDAIESEYGERIRRVNEDLRVSKARCNKYKQIHAELESQLATEEAKTRDMGDKIRALKDKIRAIAAMGGSETSPFDPAGLKAELAERDARIVKLEHEVSVLTKAKDLAEKREALKAKENRAGKDHYREQAHMV
jgi:hypothetical protein